MVVSTLLPAGVEKPLKVVETKWEKKFCCNMWIEVYLREPKISWFILKTKLFFAVVNLTYDFLGFKLWSKPN